MKSLTILLVLQGTYAFPSVFNVLAEREALTKRDTAQSGCTTSSQCNAKYDVSDSDIGYDANAPTPAQQASAARDNCGAINSCSTFDGTEQLVSVTGDYAYQSPAANQIRGPCRTYIDGRDPCWILRHTLMLVPIDFSWSECCR
jgi:hypothetical protein